MVPQSSRIVNKLRSPLAQLSVPRVQARYHGMLTPALIISLSSPRIALPSLSSRPREQHRPLHSSNTACERSGIHAVRQVKDASIIENEGIKSFKILVVDADNKIGEPTTLFDALEARGQDEKGRFIEVLRQVRPAAPPTMFPICKYLNLKTLREKDLAQQKQERIDKVVKKQAKCLELTWTIGDGDLRHRMERLKDFLGQGRSVEVTLGTQRKRGWQKRKPENREVARMLIEKVKSAALEVQGAKEAKAMSGDPSEMVVLYFEGPRRAKE